MRSSAPCRKAGAGSGLCLGKGLSSPETQEPPADQSAGGSFRTWTTTHRGLAQLARAAVSKAAGWGFDSLGPCAQHRRRTRESVAGERASTLRTQEREQFERRAAGAPTPGYRPAASTACRGGAIVPPPHGPGGQRQAPSGKARARVAGGGGSRGLSSVRQSACVAHKRPRVQIAQAPLDRARDFDRRRRLRRALSAWGLGAVWWRSPFAPGRSRVRIPQAPRNET